MAPGGNVTCSFVPRVPETCRTSARSQQAPLSLWSDRDKNGPRITVSGPDPGLSNTPRVSWVPSVPFTHHKPQALKGPSPTTGWRQKRPRSKEYLFPRLSGMGWEAFPCVSGLPPTSHLYKPRATPLSTWHQSPEHLPPHLEFEIIGDDRQLDIQPGRWW